MKRYDPDGNEKHRARKSERRCGYCYGFITAGFLAGPPNGGGVLRLHTNTCCHPDSMDVCRADDAACPHFIERKAP